MNKTKLTYKVARKIYDSYRFLVADFKIKNLKKELKASANWYDRWIMKYIERLY